jgi:hypothetical protein
MFVLLMAIGCGACGLQPASTGNRSDGSATTPLAVPLVGDARAGRQAFLDLKCTTCHRVPSEPEFPLPISDNSGPPLDTRLARSLPNYLVTAIVSPSHELANMTSEAVRARMAGTLSPMGDFSQVMSVRQLVDVHAFLASLK